MGMNYKDFHAEDLDTQRKLGKLNTQKILFHQDSKAPTNNLMVKRLACMYMDMELADHTQMTIECKRLGSKINKSMDFILLRVIQECITCRHKDPTFTQGKGQKYRSGFNTDVLFKRKPVRNDYYYTHLCIFSGVPPHRLQVQPVS